MPPSGPMMRAQGPMMAGPGGYQQAAPPQAMNMGPRAAYTMARHQRPPNVSIGPEGLNIGGRVGAGPGPGVGSQEWRHMMMSQQQSMAFSQQMGGGVSHPQQQAQQQMRPGNFNSQPGKKLYTISYHPFDIIKTCIRYTGVTFITISGN